MQKTELKRYFATFFIYCSQLLVKEHQNLEVAYNVAGTLSHLMSDGPVAWTCPHLDRDVVRQNMYDVIETWDIESARNINYR